MAINKYDDIIDLPHHQSKTHKEMSRHDRAAQFSPFAALTGHSEAIVETARLTKAKKMLTQDEKDIISEKLVFLREVCEFRPTVYITFFVNDSRKKGGEYVSLYCRITKLDENAKVLITDRGDIISFEDIYSLEGDVFCE